MKYLGLCLGLLLICISVSATAEEKTLRVNDSSDPNGKYVIGMIKLALEHIDKKYKLEVTEKDYTKSRIDAEVSNGNLDITWSSSNAEREAQFRPVLIPLYKGLLGYRVFIINKDDQAKFDNIKTLDDLKKLKMGQGKTWADTKILESNGLNIVEVNKYQSLFYMVEGGRFDAFPRGVHEPFGELAQHPKLNLGVEKNLMLVYKMPFYLFVAKDNVTLANDLYLGLNRAIEDGSFDKTFLNAPAVQDVIQKVNLKHRRIIHLNNPTLSKETPLDRPELWFDPQSLP